MATSSVTLTKRPTLVELHIRVRRLKLPWVAIFILAVMLVCAGFAPWLAPHDPTDKDILNNRIAPWVNMTYPLGTDVLGRDILSRLIYGARTTVFISLVALGTGAAVGTILGLMSGYLGGWIDAIIMRVADAAMGFPTTGQG